MRFMTEPALETSIGPDPSREPQASRELEAGGAEEVPVAAADLVGPGRRAEAPPRPRATAPVREVEGNGTAPCTQAQLRRFIKSRPYVPIHELRRRFALNGPEDEVSPVDVGGRLLFVGLPARESTLLGDLLRQGDVGYELLLDPVSPLIVGVYPMRPVQRP
jgi:hypothetical protein